MSRCGDFFVVVDNDDDGTDNFIYFTQLYNTKLEKHGCPESTFLNHA